MNLSKALKQKNRIAGEIDTLKTLLTSQNVKPSTQKFDYQAEDLLRDLQAKIAELVELKAQIATANVEIYTKIFRLAEIKGLTKTLKDLDTRSGLFKEGEGYGQTPYDVEYVAQISKTEADTLVTGFESEIETLQDELDAFNFTTTVG